MILFTKNENGSWPQIYNDLTRKTNFFEGCSWFRFNSLRLALAIALNLYTRLAQGLKLKVRKFWWLILKFAEVTGENLVGESGR